MRPDAMVQLDDAAPELEGQGDLHDAGHEGERRDERQQGHCSRAGVGEHDHPECDRQHAAQHEQQRASAAEPEGEREGDLEAAERDRPRGDRVEQPQRREVGPDEDDDADGDAEQAFEDEPAPPASLNRNVERSGDRPSPETSAYAPNSAISDVRPMFGQTRTTTAKAIASTPRSAVVFQMWASTCSPSCTCVCGFMSVFLSVELRG